MMQGEGQMNYHDGSFYVGSWLANQHHGYGEYVMSEHARYEGYFANGKFSGAGRYSDDNGEAYEGSWLEG